MSIIVSNVATGDNDFLFAKSKLTNLSIWPDINNQLAAKNLLARPLRLGDYHNGYLELLRQLTQVGEVSLEMFESRFQQMKQINKINDHYVIVVFEDTQTKRIVATSTLFLEYKFIHQCSMRGRLEDVAVLDSYRKNHFGGLIVKIIVELAREAYKCYKLTLDCTDELIKFYAKNNFSPSSNMLTIVFDERK